MHESSKHIAELIQQGRKLEAIKLLRETTGVSLQEAKEEVERLSAGMPPSTPAREATHEAALPEDVLALARAGQKIEAIKLLRERTGLGLKEAKERVDAATGGSGAGCGAVFVLVLLIGAAVVVGCRTTPNESSSPPAEHEPSPSADTTGAPVGIWRPNEDATGLVFAEPLASGEATAPGMVEALNQIYPPPQYPGLALDSVARRVAYLRVLDDARLTEQMGSTGSMAYMGAVTFSFTSLPGIDSVYFAVAPGSHAGPGYASRARWQSYFEVPPPASP